MASKKANVTTKKKTAAKKANVATKKKTAAKKAPKKDSSKTLTATITLTGEPAELKASVEEIIEAAKKVIEKELRKQIKKT